MLFIHLSRRTKKHTLWNSVLSDTLSLNLTLPKYNNPPYNPCTAL